MDVNELESYGCMLLDEMPTKWKIGDGREFKLWVKIIFFRQDDFTYFDSNERLIILKNFE